MTTTAVAERQPRNNAEVLFALIEKATTESDFSVEKLTQLLDVKERWDREEARKAYVAALAQFKRNPPAIVKTETVDFSTGRGRTHYRYASLGNVADAVGAALSHHGLSHSWAIEQHGGNVKVTCTLTHEAGHSEQVAIEGPHDDTGNKNSIQQIGSAITYLQRYTLMAITGLAAMDQDDDGRGGARSNARHDPQSNQPMRGEVAPPNDVSQILDAIGRAVRARDFDAAGRMMDDAINHPDADMHQDRIAAAQDALRQVAQTEAAPDKSPVDADENGVIVHETAAERAERKTDELFANLPDPGP